jgi:hypothetical protein
MASGYTIFLTYQFEDSPASASTSYGYAPSIHCNYIQTITTDTLAGKALNMFFSSANDLPFFADTGSTNGTGFTATKLNAIVQVINGVSDSGTTITPSANGWFIVDLTDQINNHVLGAVIDKNSLVNTLFNIEFNTLTEPYTLDYLDYPSNVSSSDEMGFGEEAFFFGTVRSDIRATVYTTDIPINLALNTYNSTTNPTWDGVSPVAISEIGIYDDNNNLVGIGKLNYPINKDATIARTIAFEIDF